MQALPVRFLIVGLVGLFCTFVIFWITLPSFFHTGISQNMRLEEGRKLWNEWTDIKVKVYFKVYVFNVTNPDEILKGASPKLVSIGPYVYDEVRTNKIVSVNLENNTVRYEPTLTYYFNPELSNGTEDDVITMLNVPLVAIAHELRSFSRISRFFAKQIIETYDEKLFIQRTIKLAFFEGVHMDLLDSLSGITGDTYLPNNTFGYFYEKNKTLPLELEINSGFRESKQVGQILLYNGKTELDIWNGESCNMINGSDSTIFPPFITKQSVLNFFEHEICRSITLVFDKEVVFNAVLGYRFVLPEDFFDSKTPWNQCFCMEKEKSNCPADGALSISACKFRAPMLISNPHFLNGDPSYIQNSGLTQPTAELHESFLIAEPHTGTLLKASKRLQMNIQMEPSSDISALQKVPKLTFPLFWLSQEMVQRESDVEEIKTRLLIPLIVAEIGKWISIFINLIFISVGIIILKLRLSSKKPHDYIHPLRLNSL